MQSNMEVPVTIGFGSGMTMRKKSFGNIVIAVMSDETNETFLVCGGASVTFTLNGWTTIATITDSDYIPSSTIRGIAADANGLAKQLEFYNDGGMKVYGSGSFENPYIAING